MSERGKEEGVAAFAAPLVGFRSRKAAQICAYFVLKSNGHHPGVIEKLKLIKLVYLAERKYLADNLESMLLDELYSLPHGPICSSTLNGINGAIHHHIWDQFLAHNGNEVCAIKHFGRDDFDEVSDDEIDTLENVWTQFGHMTASQLRNWTHENCPEYTEVSPGRRLEITYREILEALGVEGAEDIDRRIADFRRAESVLGA